MPTDEEIWAALECAHAPERVNALDPSNGLAATYPEAKASVDAWLDRKSESDASREFGMVACKGSNVIGVGYKDGVLRVCFAGKDGPRFWRYPGVPADEFVKLSRSPYPDRLFTTNVRNKFKGQAEAA